ncbi:polysaccharide pyruvyl transferase family protein [Salinibacterium sp. SYSU T00001]|uniref:polysaccharide pyruvyl transferase family protein n=1 Tax=Homoserinimonas sedimenticola TaxID=2986805 RepID=UPI00223609AC|nr:polysaccharide pyruvyl transferase family protein [Salinibacterium sedimenticola]MCW4384768.1 polysaccharide pyruvyl transferase family protein [Salinibacterium sedimenticola]
MTDTIASTAIGTRQGQVALGDGNGVPVVHWDPLRRTGRWGRPSRWSRPVRNFGDLLGPMIVARLAAGLPRPPEPDRRLVAVGSILHFAAPGDVVWGTGVNPKGELDAAVLRTLDVRAVRGPRTAQLLRESYGLEVPSVYGDPGLLLPNVFPELSEAPSRTRRAVTVIPNLNDLAPRSTLPASWRGHVVNPRSNVTTILRRIRDSSLVVGSSLHAVIVAESMGIPARAVATPHEDPFKYEDYYLGTGRDPKGLLASSVEEALDLGGAPPLNWDSRPLLDAFPRELWTGQR